MSSTIEAVKAALAADTQVAAAVGARVYPLRLPQNVAFPAVVLGEVSNVPANTLAGLAGATTTTRLQVDVYAKSYPEAASVTQLIDAALARLRGPAPALTVWREVSRDLFDDELALYRRSSDFSVWR